MIIIHELSELYNIDRYVLSIVNELAVASALRERGRCETRRALMRCGFHCEKRFHTTFSHYFFDFLSKFRNQLLINDN